MLPVLVSSTFLLMCQKLLLEEREKVSAEILDLADRCREAIRVVLPNEVVAEPGTKQSNSTHILVRKTPLHSSKKQNTSSSPQFPRPTTPFDPT